MATFPEPWGLLGRLYGLDPESAIAVPLDVDLSMFSTAWQAHENSWRSDQRVARVPLQANRRIFIARTDRHRPGHHDVWIPQDVLENVLSTIEILE